MPKPIFGDNGSGMHTHISLWKDEKPLFAGNGYAGLSDMALFFIGGILKHAPALTCLTNPTNNPIDLARCPSYVETATAVTAGAADTGTKEAYTLNCAPGVIGAGESVRFEMRVGIPADVGGEFEILWDLGVPRRTPPARGTVSVVGSSR